MCKERESVLHLTVNCENKAQRQYRNVRVVARKKEEINCSFLRREERMHAAHVTSLVATWSLLVPVIWSTRESAFSDSLITLPNAVADVASSIQSSSCSAARASIARVVLL